MLIIANAKGFIMVPKRGNSMANIKKRTRKFIQEISLMNDKNTTIVLLENNTKTTPIMDKFYFSDKLFIVFESVLGMYTDRGWRYISLVVRKNNTFEKIDCIDDDLTVSDLKKYRGTQIRGNPFDNKSRLYSLVNEIIQASKQISDSKIPISFEHAIRLGGQTFENQSGYGNYYYGETLLVQGTYYGETTGFYIIGAIFK